MLLARAPPPPPSAFSSPAPSVRAFRRRRLAAPGAAATAASKSPSSLRGGQRHKQVASVANPLVKHCVKLRDSAAYRRSCRRLVLVGLAPILEICRLGLAAIDCLLLLDGAEVPGELHELSGGNAVYVSATVMKKISGMQSVDSTEAIAVMHMPKHFCDLGDDEGGAGLDASFQSPKRILVLDAIQVKKMSGTPPLFSSSLFVQKMGRSHIVRGAVAYLNSEVVYLQCISQAWVSILNGASDPVMILISDTWQDPGNLGTLIRSACAFKWDGVFLLPACCDPFNEKALRAARGASLQLPIVSGNWCDLHALVTRYGMKMLAGHPESSSDGPERTHELSKELADSLMSESLCLVLGSEGNGLSEETVQACDLVSIPMEVHSKYINLLLPE